jgi:hypothetical protein
MSICPNFGVMAFGTVAFGTIDCVYTFSWKIYLSVLLAGFPTLKYLEKLYASQKFCDQV